MKRAIALAMFAMLFAACAHAETPMGDAVPSVLTIAGKQVPLPEGNWIIAGRAPGAVTRGSGLGSYGAIWNLVLFRIAPSGVPDAMAEININAMAVDDGWGIAADCQRSDLLLTVVRSRAGWDAACFFVTHAAWSAWEDSQPDMPQAWRQARDLAAKRKWGLPTHTVTAGFRVANRRDVIDVRFHFLADAAGSESAGWDASPSGREKRPQDRRRLAIDRDIAEWSAMMIGCIEAGLKNRLSASRPVPGPGVGDAVLERSSILHAKQQRLAYLRSSGQLSAEQFELQSASLRQAEADDSHDAVAPTGDDFYRLLRFQGLSVTSDAVVTFLWTAQSVQAAAMTLVQAGLRTGRSYVVSYLWDQYGGTPTRPDTARTVDFAYGGAER
jgi:hypothetical protein